MGRHSRIGDESVEAPGARDEMALDRQLCFALCSANNHLVRIYGAALEPLGLTVPQTLVLLALFERSPRLVGNIAQTLTLDNGSITPMLKRLEAQGFLIRVRDTVDERRVNVHITDKGRSIKEPIMATRRRVIDNIGISEMEMDVLNASLKRFSKLLSQSAHPDPVPLVSAPERLPGSGAVKSKPATASATMERES